MKFDFFYLLIFVNVRYMKEKKKIMKLLKLFKNFVF